MFHRFHFAKCQLSSWQCDTLINAFGFAHTSNFAIKFISISVGLRAGVNHPSHTRLRFRNIIHIDKTRCLMSLVLILERAGKEDLVRRLKILVTMRKQIKENSKNHQRCLRFRSTEGTSVYLKFKENHSLNETRRRKKNRLITSSMWSKFMNWWWEERRKKKSFEKTEKRSTRDEWLFNDARRELLYFEAERCTFFSERNSQNCFSKISQMQEYEEIICNDFVTLSLLNCRSMTFEGIFEASHVCHISSHMWFSSHCISDLNGWSLRWK